MTSERVNQPLGRIAELLVEDHAKVSLNEIRDLFEAVDARAYAEASRWDNGAPTTAWVPWRCVQRVLNPLEI